MVTSNRFGRSQNILIVVKVVVLDISGITAELGCGFVFGEIILLSTVELVYLRGLFEDYEIIWTTGLNIKFKNIVKLRLKFKNYV